MLVGLSVKGLALIDKLHLRFADGFNVITGETGAGKSVLIKAIQFGLGGKSSTSIIRSGYRSTEVSATFLLQESHPVIIKLENIGISINEDRTLIVRRHLNDKGRNSCWMNDTPVAVSTLRELSSELIDVFGQLDNSIFDYKHHLYYVDQFVSEKKLKIQFDQIYKKIQNRYFDLKKHIKLLSHQDGAMDYIRFRLEEVSHLNISEYKELQRRCIEFEQNEKIIEPLKSIYQILKDNSLGYSPISKLQEIKDSLSRSELQQNKILNLVKLIEQSCIDLEELSFETDTLLSEFEQSESNIDAYQERLAQYQEILRKLQLNSIDDLIEKVEQMKLKLSQFEDANLHIMDCLAEIRKLSTQALSISKLLSDERVKAGKILGKNLCNELKDLAIPKATFQVSQEEKKLRPSEIDFSNLELQYREDSSKLWSDIVANTSQFDETGADKIRFLFSANKGEPLQFLEKVASGGEASRIMLALKKCLAISSNPCVLVFDEIDSGISGEVADRVGKKMKELAKFFQIICISHLPQVAVYSDKHFIVEKTGKNSRTSSHIKELSPSQSIFEIARLVSGEGITESSLIHAENLIKNSKSHEFKEL